MLKNIVVFSALIIIACSCNDNTVEHPMLSDNFVRSEMLEFWSDDIIIPAYSAYLIELNDLKIEANAFFLDPNQTHLNDFRKSWLDAYLVWQKVSLFEIGKAEEIGLRNFTNIYPTNTDLIRTNLEDLNYNLELPSQFSAQGFPALDYLLYGIENDDDSIINVLSTIEFEQYTTVLIDRLILLSTQVLDDWNQRFRDDFISNSGSSATASTDKLVNDFLFYYEKHLRAAKIGIPAGVFSGTEDINLVEAKYAKIYSKSLFVQGLGAVRDFFSGVSFDGQKLGPSLKQYLDDIHLNNNTDLDYSKSILAQWDAASIAVSGLNDSFYDQILDDNIQMLAAYDELQKAVIFLKVDMLQALNIQVDFVDADGD